MERVCQVFAVSFAAVIVHPGNAHSFPFFSAKDLGSVC